MRSIIITFIFIATSVRLTLGAERAANDNNNLESLLFSAVESLSVDKVRAAIEQGADVHARNERQQTPIVVAACFAFDKNEMLYRVLESTTDDFHADLRNRDEILEILMDAGAYTNFMKQYNALRGQYPCFKKIEVESWDSKRVEYEEKHGMPWRSVLKKIRRDETCLLCDAVEAYNIDEVQALITNGANIEAKNEYGHTPLTVAAGLLIMIDQHRYHQKISIRNQGHAVGYGYKYDLSKIEEHVQKRDAILHLLLNNRAVPLISKRKTAGIYPYIRGAVDNKEFDFYYFRPKWQGNRFDSGTEYWMEPWRSVNAIINPYYRQYRLRLRRETARVISRLGLFHNEKAAMQDFVSPLPQNIGSLP